MMILFSGPSQTKAETVAEQDLPVNAVTQIQPPLIALSWPASTTAVQYEVYRKSKDATSWGSAVATLEASATSYTDSNILAGVNYAYRVTKKDKNHGGEGFVYCGIQTPHSGAGDTAPANAGTNHLWSAWAAADDAGEAYPGGAGGNFGGGGASGMASRPSGSSTNAFQPPGGWLVFYPATNQDSKGGQAETAFAPEPGTYTAAAAVLACLSLLRVRRNARA